MHKLAVLERYPDEEYTFDVTDSINHGTLEFIVGGAFGAESHIKLAAYLMYEISTKHPFGDGNKRTAFLVALTIVGIGKKVEADSQGRSYDFIEKAWNLFSGLSKKSDLSITEFVKDVAADGEREEKGEPKKYSVEDVEKFLLNLSTRI